MSGEHLDEMRLSAVLDGDAEQADSEHLSTCDECASRLSTWQDASRLVGEAPAVPPGSIDAAVAAAVEAFDERPLRRHRAVRWTAAAALVLVAAGALTAGLRSEGTSPKQAASSAATNSPQRTTAPAQKPSATPSAQQQQGLPAHGTAQLGSVPSTAALVARLHAALRASGSSDAAVAAPSSLLALTPLCDSRFAGTGVYEAELTFEGRPAVVFVFSRAGGDEAVVVTSSGCTVLAETKL